MAVLNEPAALYRPTELLHIALSFPDPSKYPGTPQALHPPSPTRASCPVPYHTSLPRPARYTLPPRRLTRRTRAQQRSTPAR